MLVIDIVLVAILLVALVIGVQRGLLASLGVLIGVVLGGLAAFWLVPIVNDVWPWQSTRVFAVIAVVLVLVIGGASAGGALGGALRRGVDRSAPLRVVDRVLGGAFAVLAGALSLSLVSASVTAYRSAGDLRGARVVAGDQHDRGAHSAACHRGARARPLRRAG